jgi:hypothetical protein
MMLRSRDNDPVQVRIQEIQSRRGAPMSEQSWLHMLEREGLGEQWVVQQIDLAYAQIVGGTPPGVHTLQLDIGQGAFGRFCSADMTASLCSGGLRQMGHEPFKGSRNHSDHRPLR